MLDADERITVPRAAELMDMPGSEIYQLIFRGEIDGRPEPGRGVLVSVASIERWLAEHPPGGSPGDTRG